jgi:hypothetical protein
MAIIYSYPDNTNILLTDLLIGTSTVRIAGKKKNLTKNFTVEALGNFISLNNPTVWGTIDGDLENQIDLWNALQSKQGNITLTTSGTEGPSTLIGDVLNIPQYSGGGSQNLQQVTDIGNITTNDIIVSDGAYESYIGPEGTIYSKNILSDRFIAINADYGLAFIYYGFNFYLQADNYTPTNDIKFFLPTSKLGAEYTIATTDDIPTIGTWGALNYPIWSSGTPFVKMTAAGTFALDTNTYLTTAVTSIDITVPPAFSVTPSSITTSGTFAITGAGTASQYVRGDGTLANFPTSTGGGSSFNYYLNGSISQGTFGGNTYYQMSRTPILGAGTNFTRTNGAGNGYIASFITDAGDPNQLNIPGGNWNVEFWFQASSGGGTPSFYAELYKVDAINVFTLIASDSLNPEGITNGTVVDQYFTSIPVPQTALLTTDRLAVRIFVNTGGRTITLHTENGNLSEVLTTFSSGLTALNGLTQQVQYLAVGTSGTDFNIDSALETHTFNLPSASATARGLVTINGQTFAGAKTLSTAPILSSLTASQLLALDASKNVQSLDTATYPSLTELSYVKGVTSPIQAQLNKIKTLVRQTPNARYQLSSDLTWKGWAADVFFFTALPSTILGTGTEPTLTNINFEQGIITTNVIKVLKNIRFNMFGTNPFEVEIAIYKSDYNATVNSNVSNIRKIYGGSLIFTSGSGGPLYTTAQRIINITDIDDTPINHISKYTLYFKNITGGNYLRYYLDWNFENS